MGRSDRRSRSRSRGRDRDRRRDRSRSRERKKDHSKSRSRSPPRRQKRKGGWDDTGGLSLPTPQAMGIDPNDPMAEQQARMLAVQQQQLLGILPQQQAGSKKQRELYVGNLTVGMVTENMLRELFTNLITAIPSFDPTLGPPITNVQISGEGKFAFVETRDETIAATGIKFNLVELCGRPLKIGRPSGYVQPAHGAPRGLDIPTEMLLKLGISGQAGTSHTNPAMAANKKQRELYVGNLAVGVLQPAMLRELFMAPMMTLPGANPNVPPVLNCEIDASGKFGFVEFATEELATTALQLFDKMELCGRNINLGRPSGYVEPGSAQAHLQAMQVNTLGMGGVMPGLPGMGALPELSLPATELLCLNNMVTQEMLADDTEYNEICEDIEEECKKSGPVIKMTVPREGTNAGKAYILFEQSTAAADAYSKLNGRQFDGNTVTAVYMTPTEFPE